MATLEALLPRPPSMPAGPVSPVRSPELATTAQRLQGRLDTLSQPQTPTAPQAPAGPVSPLLAPYQQALAGAPAGVDLGASLADRIAGMRGVDPASVAGHGANGVIRLAQTQLGVPYVFGAFNPAGGAGGPGAALDCSGFTEWVASRVGVNLPHSAAQQSQILPKVARSHLQPGDFIFYDYGRLGGAADHVAIYMGNGQQIAASSSADKVAIQGVDWSHLLWGGRLQGGRRHR